MVELPPLSPYDFADFFEAVHGVQPFPWQIRLLEDIARAGSWPDLLDLPTGVGKTAALDIAIFHLALEAGRHNVNGEQRRAPMRIIFVVDRRTIVDQAHRRAKLLADAIENASHPVLASVQARLASLSRDGQPLVLAQLRGGMPRSDVWARSPDQPVIAVSTVDQAGSRLLFRGYGISDEMRSIHAGLLGHDALWLLDEVHLSKPFRDTLRAIADRWRGWREVELPGGFGVVEMSATPGGDSSRSRFSLATEDHEHVVLQKRLTASKPTTLIDNCKERDFVKHASREAQQLVSTGLTARRRIAVVVNRVQTAREIAAMLIQELGSKAEVMLVTGRMRPHDRTALEGRLMARVAAGVPRSLAQLPIIVVATQCIEAGADFDFDGLVTECASLDALRQRFGRLNRLGDHPDARGVVLGRSGKLTNDPVYGYAIEATLGFLRQVKDGIDFGLSARLMPPADQLESCLAATVSAPVLLPGHLDAWVQTAPIPEPDPDVSLWLHGPTREMAEVQLVWRRDVSEELIALAASDSALAGEARDVILGLLEALPPTPGEALSIPIAAARRWLEGRDEPAFSDVEGEAIIDEGREPVPPDARHAVVWRSDGIKVSEGRALQPGDTVVVPVTRGGLRSGTWDPHGPEADDIAELASYSRTGRAVLRLRADIVGEGLPPVPTPVDEGDERAHVIDWLRAVRSSLEGHLLGPVLAALAKDGRPRVSRLATNVAGASGEPTSCLLVVGRVLESHAASTSTTEADVGSFTGRAITLTSHLQGVAGFAGDFAERLGLGAVLAADMRLAGAWHDAGKIDPRFQRLLHGGDAFKAMVAPEPIAKSGLVHQDRAARKRAGELSGYPRGGRHELLSVALLQKARVLDGANDPELVLHLVASHHGYCRPLAPVVFDTEPVEVRFEAGGEIVEASSLHGLARLDSGVGERFWNLVRRYGWWGLAWLEAILRLADHRRSEFEQRQGGRS